MKSISALPQTLRPWEAVGSYQLLCILIFPFKLIASVNSRPKTRLQRAPLAASVLLNILVLWLPDNIPSAGHYPHVCLICLCCRTPEITKAKENWFRTEAQQVTVYHCFIKNRENPQDFPVNPQEDNCMTAAFTLCTRKRDQQLPQLGNLHKSQSGSTARIVAEMQLCGEEHLHYLPPVLKWIILNPHTHSRQEHKQLCLHLRSLADTWEQQRCRAAV